MYKNTLIDIKYIALSLIKIYNREWGDTVEKNYTAQQIAEYLHVKVNTVWLWFRIGKLKYFTVGRKKLVKESDLTRFVESGGNHGDL